MGRKRDVVMCDGRVGVGRCRARTADSGSNQVGTTIAVSLYPEQSSGERRRCEPVIEVVVVAVRLRWRFVERRESAAARL
jgi:hypothetical protein